MSWNELGSLRSEKQDLARTQEITDDTLVKNKLAPTPGALKDLLHFY